MNHLFHPFLKEFLLIFFYDILVYNRSVDNDEQHMKKVFHILPKNVLHVNMKKCQIACKELKFLGHWVSSHGVMANRVKVEAMISWPAPTNLKQLWGFLGLIGYYRQFVRDYSLKAASLIALLKKDAFTQNDDTQRAFDLLKEAMSVTPILALPNFDLPFVIETDASYIGLGVVLIQNNRSVAYFNQALPKQSQVKFTNEHELIVIVLLVQNGDIT